MYPDFCFQNFLFFWLIVWDYAAIYHAFYFQSNFYVMGTKHDMIQSNLFLIISPILDFVTLCCVFHSSTSDIYTLQPIDMIKQSFYDFSTKFFNLHYRPRCQN